MYRFLYLIPFTLAHATSAQASAESDSLTVSALQWNPHWQCFSNNASLAPHAAECKANVMTKLRERLLNGTDFANVVMLEAKDFAMPAAWRAISSYCSKDVTSLFYDSSRWKPSGTPQKGCMVPKDRPYVVQTFEHRSQDLRVVVIGAHFPHKQIGTTLSQSLRKVVNETGIKNVMLIADTNIKAPGAQPNCPKNICLSSGDILRTLGAPIGSQEPISTKLLKTCCDDWKFEFEFDRIISTFGHNMTTQLHDDPVPSWAIGAFHKAVTGRFVVPLQSSDRGHDISMQKPVMV